MEDKLLSKSDVKKFTSSHIDHLQTEILVVLFRLCRSSIGHDQVTVRRYRLLWVEHNIYALTSLNTAAENGTVNN